MIHKEQRFLVTLVGPTASGKTAVAVALAKQINAEIISADSRQIYRYLNIGSAKPTVAELKGVSGHLIDFLDPNETYNAGRFRQSALQIIEQIFLRGKIPLLVGGTGLYIRALLDGLCPAPPGDPVLRRQLELEAKQIGKEELYRRLKIVDPKACQKIHPNNLPRIIRALEVYLLGGIPFSDCHKLPTHPLNYLNLFLGLNWPREQLYARIDYRIDEMIKKGLVDEVKHLLTRGYNENSAGLLSLGYPQIIGYLNNRYDLSEAIRLIKRDSRRYAKRQITWFKKDKRIQWINLTGNFSAEEITTTIQQEIEQKFLDKAKNYN